MSRAVYSSKTRRRLSLITVFVLLLVVVLVGLGAFDRAIESGLKRALRHKDVELQDLIGQAESKVRGGHHLEAVAVYLAALARNPAGQRRHKFFELKQRTRMGLSKSLAHIGKRRRARALAEVAVREEPEYWLAHKNLGDVFLLTGKAEKAKEHYRDALGINPVDMGTLVALTGILAEDDEREALVEAYRKYLEAYALGSLKVWLDDNLVLERDVVMNGSWQRLHIRFPGNGRLRLRCSFEEEPVGVWLGEIRALTLGPMRELFLGEDARERADVVKMRIGAAPTLEPSSIVEVDGGTRFLAFDFAVSKPWTESMTRQLRKAVRGNPR